MCIFLLLSLFTISSFGEEDDNYTLQFLDGFQYLAVSGNEKFNRTFWQQLKACGRREEGFNEVFESSWHGFFNYSLTNGSNNDWGTETSWHELNHTAMYVDGKPVIICQPCNTVSNVAYMHTSLQICEYQPSDAWKIEEEVIIAYQNLLTMGGFGSSFLHGSATPLGGFYDARVTDLLPFYMIYQELVSQFPYSPVLYDLNTEPAKYSALQWYYMVEKVLLQDVTVWNSIEDDYNRDIPDEYYVWAGIVGFELSLIVDQSTAMTWFNALCKVFKCPDDMKKLLIDEMVPTFYNVTKDIKLTKLEKGQVFLKTSGTFIKIIWAFVWQEQFLVTPIIYNPEVIKAGGLLTPYVNMISNFMTGWHQPDPDVQNCSPTLYPGADRCRTTDPHALWHEESANFLFDLALLIDWTKTLIDPSVQDKRQNSYTHGLWEKLVETVYGGIF